MTYMNYVKSESLMSRRMCISRICLRKSFVQKASYICGIKYVLDSDHSTPKKYPIP